MSANEGLEISTLRANRTLHEAVVMTTDSDIEARKELYSTMKAAKFLFSDRVRFLASSDSSGALGPKTSKTTMFPEWPSNRRRGKLRGIVNLPLDIICEIATHLDPLDLLQISRINKNFASLFLSSKTRSIWRKVLKQAYQDIPECPIDLTEPQYASLLLEEFCMACGDTQVDFTSFTLRVRLCSSCKYKNIINKVAVMKLTFFTYIIPSHDSGNEQPLRRDESFSLYIKGEAEDMCKFPRDVLSNDLVSLIAEIRKSGRSISEWLKVLEQREEAQAKIAAETRTQIIFQKMEELGWESKYYPQDFRLQVRWKRSIYQEKAFNEKEWKITKRHLEGIYLESKRKIITAELDEKFRPHYYELPSNLDDQDKETMPAWMDIKSLPCVASFLEKCSNRDVPEEEWALLCPKILEQVKPIKARIRDLIVAQVKKKKPSLFKPGNFHSDDLMVLRRASCLFRCKCCHGLLLRYPEIVEHACHSADHHKEQVWSIKMQEFDANIFDLAEEILRVLGFSPDMQREELAVLDEKKFVCRCGHSNSKRPLSFEELVFHIHSQQNWYNKMLKTIKRSKKGKEKAAALLINDHDPSRLPKLVCVHNYALRSMCPIHFPYTHISFSCETRYCRYCYKVTRTCELVQSKDVRYHMKAKHGKEYTPEDLMTEKALASTYM